MRKYTKLNHHEICRVKLMQFVWMSDSGRIFDDTMICYFNYLRHELLSVNIAILH